jgi:hypothetical protein
MEVKKNTHNIILIALLVLVAIIIFREHYFPNQISYNLYESISAQYLNSVGVFLQKNIQDVGFNAYLNGIDSLESEVYSNFPVFHMFFGAMLVKSGFLNYSFNSFQVVTGVAMIVTYVLLILTVIKVSKNKTSALILSSLVLSNNFLIDSYNDLWWEPYFLFFIISQIYCIVSRKWVFLYVLAFLQFFFNYDSAVYGFTFLVGYVFIHKIDELPRRMGPILEYLWRNNFEVVIKYFTISCISFFLTATIKNIYSAEIPDIEVVLLNMYSISMEDLYRFFNYYIFSPYMVSAITFLVLMRKFFNYKFISLIVWSLVWLMIFPAHGLHHSYHYSKILLIVLYFLISIIISNSDKHVFYISILVAINLFTGYYLYKTENLDYSSYQYAIPYIEDSAIVISNHVSYPMTYYIKRSAIIKDVNEVKSECLFDSAIVINDFPQVAVGATTIYRAFTKINDLLGGYLPDLSIYVKRKNKFIKYRDKFTLNLLKCGGKVVYTDPLLRYSIYNKGVL